MSRSTLGCSCITQHIPKSAGAFVAHLRVALLALPVPVQCRKKPTKRCHGMFLMFMFPDDAGSASVCAAFASVLLAVWKGRCIPAWQRCQRVHATKFTCFDPQPASKPIGTACLSCGCTPVNTRITRRVRRRPCAAHTYVLQMPYMTQCYKLVIPPRV